MASRSVICYPNSKPKSVEVLHAFAKGCGGRVDEHALRVDSSSDAAFYGVVGIERLYRSAKLLDRERDWYYLDNSFFDKARGSQFRVGRNATQTVYPAPDHERLKALGIEIKPWRKDGRHVVLVPQSDHFMREVAGWKNGVVGWQADVLLRARRSTDRPMVMRHWSPDKIKLGATLARDLENAWALITHSSAAAIEALLAGVPVFVTDPGCAAAPFAGSLDDLEFPEYRDGREQWAAHLAGSQWTLDEIRDGKAWRTIHGG